jgi:hypothetical protein
VTKDGYEVHIRLPYRASTADAAPTIRADVDAGAQRNGNGANGNGRSHGGPHSTEDRRASVPAMEVGRG